jgi:hypothetical protein
MRSEEGVLLTYQMMDLHHKELPRLLLTPLHLDIHVRSKSTVFLAFLTGKHIWNSESQVQVVRVMVQHLLVHTARHVPDSAGHVETAVVEHDNPQKHARNAFS